MQGNFNLALSDMDSEKMRFKQKETRIVVASRRAESTKELFVPGLIMLMVMLETPP